jgi:hypothetical protein
MHKNTLGIFKYLKLVASERRIEQYVEVARNFSGSNAQSLGPNELHEIWQLCKVHRWPHLNALVVSKALSRPGIGYTPDGHPVDDDEFKIIKLEVWEFDWSDKYL